MEPFLDSPEENGSYRLSIDSQLPSICKIEKGRPFCLTSMENILWEGSLSARY